MLRPPKLSDEPPWRCVCGKTFQTRFQVWLHYYVGWNCPDPGRLGKEYKRLQS